MANMTSRKATATKAVAEPLVKKGVKQVAKKTKKETKKNIPPTPVDERKFVFRAEDDFDRQRSELICHSNNGSDHIHNTLSHARSKKLQKPILIEINSELKFRNYSLSIDEAKQLRDTLTEMIDYLEEV